MRQKDYTKINTLIDVYSEHLLSVEDFDQLLSASSTSMLMDILDDTDYRFNESDLDDSQKIDRILMDLLIAQYRFAYRESPEPELIDIFGARYMYHNLKAMLKDELLGTDTEYLLIPIGRFDFDTLFHVVQTHESSRLPQPVIDWVNEVNEMAEDYHSSEAVDIGMDMAYFDHLHGIADSYNHAKVKAIAEAMTEFYNLTTIIRAKRQDQTYSFMVEAYTDKGLFTLDEYIDIVEKREYQRWFDAFNQLPYNDELNQAIEKLKQGELSIASLEKMKDDYLAYFFQENRYAGDESLNILAYLYLREIEVTNLRLVLVGRVNGMSREQIEERMRLIDGKKI